MYTALCGYLCLNLARKLEHGGFNDTGFNMQQDWDGECHNKTSKLNAPLLLV